MRRDDSNKVRLAGSAVSSRHSRKLKPLRAVYDFEDLETDGGTFLKVVPTGHSILEEGDRIRVGDSEF